MNDLVSVANSLVTSPMRAMVNKAEAELLKFPQLDLPVTHHFSHGIYARELFIPKDTILTGKIHKFPQLNILLKGEISVLTEQGIERKTAPFVVSSPAGTKRIAYAHEDCVWITVHGTHETDLEKIEEQFIAKSDAEYLEFVAMLQDKS